MILISHRNYCILMQRHTPPPHAEMSAGAIWGGAGGGEVRGTYVRMITRSVVNAKKKRKRGNVDHKWKVEDYVKGRQVGKIRGKRGGQPRFGPTLLLLLPGALFNSQVIVLYFYGSQLL